MDLIINSGSGLASKVMGLKSEVWGFADVFITASDNCHGSFPVSFLYLLYKLKRILFVKMLGNPVNLACQSKYSGLILYRTWSCCCFIWSQINLNLFFIINSKKRLNSRIESYLIFLIIFPKKIIRSSFEVSMI